MIEGIELAADLASAALLTRLQRDALDAVTRYGEQRAAVVDRLRANGVPLSTIERATGASRAALTRHVQSAG